jgi:hypothetical protein
MFSAPLSRARGASARCALALAPRPLAAVLPIAPPLPAVTPAAAVPRLVRFPAGGLPFSTSRPPTPPPTPSGGGDVADPDVLHMLTTISKWSRTASGHMRKRYEFRDARTAERFLNQAQDAFLRVPGWGGVSGGGGGGGGDGGGSAAAGATSVASEAPHMHREGGIVVLVVGGPRAAAVAAGAGAGGTSAGAGAPAPSTHAPSSSPSPSSPPSHPHASHHTRAVMQRELDLALAADDVAAELQLGGRWN